MLSSAAINDIVQQLRAEEGTEEVPYLGFFIDEKHEEYWHIEANQAGLRKYAAELLIASTQATASANDVPDHTLDSSWLDTTGDAQPLFVKFVEAPNSRRLAEYQPNGMEEKAWKVGCLVLVVALVGVFAAGIKEILDLLNS